MIQMRSSLNLSVDLSLFGFLHRHFRVFVAPKRSLLRGNGFVTAVVGRPYIAVEKSILLSQWQLRSGMLTPTRVGVQGKVYVRVYSRTSVQVH